MSGGDAMTELAMSGAAKRDDLARYRAAEHALWRAYGLEPRERVVAVGRDGVRSRVLEVGEGPEVLFVHGSGPPGAASVWAPLVAELPEFRSIMVDLPGAGLSQPLQRPGVAYPIALADHLAELLDSIRVDRADIVGWSIGGIWTLRLAQRHPDRVRRIVQLGFSPIWSEPRPPLTIRLQTTPIGALMGRLPLTRRVVRSLLRTVVGHGTSLDAGRIPAEMIDWIVALGRHTATARNERAWLPALIGVRGARPGLPLDADELRSIGKPLLYVYGTSDWPGSREMAERTTALMPVSAVLPVDQGGHAPWLDDPAHIAGELTRFLARRS